jgi:nitrite reductase (NADH) small subunit
MSWIDIGAIDRIPDRGARGVRTPRGDIAVFRTGTAEVFATDDRLGDSYGPLSDGIVSDRSVNCPITNVIFDLETGQSSEGSLQTHGCRIENGRVLLAASKLTAAA